MHNSKDNIFLYQESLLQKLPRQVVQKKLTTILCKQGKEFPIMAYEIGPQNPEAPVIAFIGGVHGLEKVGSQVVLSYLNYIFQQLHWNFALQELFKRIRLVSIPIVNPVGIYYGHRSNVNGVDLMRNAPVQAVLPPPFLLGGQRFSHYLPWYMGDPDQMEIESQVLVNYIKEQVISHHYALSIDFHSGFGLKDRLWFPYAKTTSPFEEIESVKRIEILMRQTIPHHIYQLETQSDSYTTHGDLWDYLYEYKLKNHPEHHFIPWTLEMGSWIWLKKNPLQIFNRHGLFNPIKDHRYARVMRRHYLMLDFFLKITENYQVWI